MKSTNLRIQQLLIIGKTPTNQFVLLYSKWTNKTCIVWYYSITCLKWTLGEVDLSAWDIPDCIPQCSRRWRKLQLCKKHIQWPQMSLESSYIQISLPMWSPQHFVITRVTTPTACSLMVISSHWRGMTCQIYHCGLKTLVLSNIFRISQ